MKLQRNLWSYKEILNFGNIFTGKATFNKIQGFIKHDK